MSIPMIMQIQSSDNGGAALAMMLAHFGKYVGFEEMRSHCIASRNGSDPGQVAAAAEYFGLSARIEKIPAGELFSQKLPLLVCWKKRYYAILTRVGRNNVTLMDPAKGKYLLTKEKFLSQYQGRAILLAPTEDFRADGRRPNPFAFLAERLKGRKRWLMILFALAAAGVLLNMLYLSYKERMIDEVMAGGDRGSLLSLTAIMILILLLHLGVDVFSTVTNAKVSARMAASSCADLYKKLLRLPLPYFEKINRGEIMDRLEKNITIDRNILNTLAPKLFNACALVFYLVLIYRYNAVLSTILIAVHLLFSFLMLSVQQGLVIMNRSILSSGEALRSSMMTALNSIDSIKANGSEQPFFQLWNDQMNEDIDTHKRSLWLDSLYTMLQTCQSVSESAIMLIAGAYLIIRGHLTIGMLSCLQSVFSHITSNMTSMFSAARQIQTISTGIERVNDLRNYKTAPEIPLTEEEPDKLSGRIEAEHLTFRYNEGDKPALQDVSLSIAPGELVALVGASGCGKSTLMKLIAGMYEVQEGSILYDGKTRSEIPDVIFHMSVGCVDQDINMFADSVRANLKMWDPSVEEYEMIMAALDAQIHKRIMQNHDGYDSMISGNGRNYSGGEQQRLELARALSIEATFLILDEFTSALDALTEEKVFQAIRNKRTTCLIAAHRLSTIVGCDRIIVMDQGRIAEEGTYDELYAKKGLFYRLVSLQ